MLRFLSINFLSSNIPNDTHIRIYNIVQTIGNAMLGGAKNGLLSTS
jgi:hypothetical protein